MMFRQYTFSPRSACELRDCLAIQIFMTFCMEAHNSMPQQQHPFAPRQDPSQLPDPNNRPLIVDGSLWLHAPKALLWLVTEASVIALSCYDHYIGTLPLNSMFWCSMDSLL